MGTTYYFLPTRNLFGEDSVKETGSLMQSLGGKKTLIVTDAFLAKQGMARMVQDILKDSGVESVVFGGVEPNPKDVNVEAGLKVFKENGCDSIISLGGGSSHDCAKGIGIVASNGGNIRDYEGVDKSQKPMCPMVAINTTAGTASEITRFCIITDTSRHVKMAIVDWRVTPQIAINDPKLMVGMPPSLTAATGMDALTHAIEAYVSTANCNYTDPLAIHAIELIQANLVKSYNGDMDARDTMHDAQCLAGQSFSNALLGIVHSMAHKTGAAFVDQGGHIIHGAANAMYLPKVIAFNAKDPTAKKRYGVIADYMHLGGANDDEKVALLIKYLRGMNDELNIPHGINKYGADGMPAETGFVPEDIFLARVDEIADNAIADACTGSNPRIPNHDEMVALLKACYYDTEVDF